MFYNVTLSHLPAQFI